MAAGRHHAQVDISDCLHIKPAGVHCDPAAALTRALSLHTAFISRIASTGNHNENHIPDRNSLVWLDFENVAFLVVVFFVCFFYNS